MEFNSYTLDTATALDLIQYTKYCTQSIDGGVTSSSSALVDHQPIQTVLRKLQMELMVVDSKLMTDNYTGNMV